MVFVSLWSLFYAVEYNYSNYAFMMLFNVFPFFAGVFVPILWLCFVLDYTGRKSCISLRNLACLLIIPVLTLAVILTNGYHGLFVNAAYNSIDGFGFISLFFGPWYYIYIFYSYLLIFLGFLFLLWTYIPSPRHQRVQISYVMAGALIPFIGNIIFVTGFAPDNLFDLTPFFFLLTGIMIYIGVFRVPLAEIIPEAYKKVFRSMIEGVIVADRNGVIIDINSSAETIMEIKSKDKVGLRVSDIFQDISEDMVYDLNRDNVRKIIETDGDGGKKYILFQSAPLEPEAVNCGFILLLRDKTSEFESNMREKKSIVQIEKNLEQLAILNDHIRNPLSVIVAISSLDENPDNKEILKQAGEIDRIIDELDNNYLKSDKIRRVLRNHYDMELKD
ncbi:PAS domain-containing protein [Methanoplanus endosymbiosus]|uniref:PAS domain-containing protein n=2 Tax=Methanoplanus endosymbiosus TaxID=33865 RepID=A0A9E7PNA4_9EURY|nr:histidine kinase N-terminal 7TM domain-containing protein [Methanoplanus endosymbiosus]UUX93440.1 PAS domain-containing protein [Methanoplanus endosymbiosus]